MGVEWGSAEFGDVGQYRHFYRFGKLFVHAQFGHRFRENHVGAGFHAGLCALNRGIQTFYRQRIGARHDHEVFVYAGINRSFDAIHHFVLRYDGFVRAVAAAFLRHLVFDVHGGHTGALKVADAAGNVKGAAPTHIDVYQQRGVYIIGNAACINQHVFHGGDAQIGNAARAGCYAAAGQVNGFETAVGSEAGEVGVDTADNGQRVFRLNGFAKAQTGRMFRHK